MLFLITVWFSIVWLMSQPGSACEGECIVGITNAFLSNYSVPVAEVLLNISSQINGLLPTSSQLQDPTAFVQPIVTAYKNMSYDSLENAIFPSYFHGKCQRFSKDGQDPPGCPDPDCPVVCGTPGSLVHFYSTLRYIAYNDTRSLLEQIVTPDGETFKKIQDAVENAENSYNRLLRRWPSSYLTFATTELNYHKRNHTLSARKYEFSRFEDDIVVRSESNKKRSSTVSESDLKGVLDQMGSLLVEACGGNPVNATGGLPDCSWEDAMKAYILSFN